MSITRHMAVCGATVSIGLLMLIYSFLASPGIFYNFFDIGMFIAIIGSCLFIIEEKDEMPASIHYTKGLRSFTRNKDN
ncbi:MAG: hypothetical protein QXQ39_05155 [Conexivisphaerales archaeon]